MRREFKNKNTNYLIFFLLGLAFVLLGLNHTSYQDGVEVVGRNYPMILTGILLIVLDTYLVYKKITDKKNKK